MDDDCTLSTLVVSVDTDPTEKLLLDDLTLSTILDDSCTTEVCVILGVEISVEDIPPSVAAYNQVKMNEVGNCPHYMYKLHNVK